MPKANLEEHVQAAPSSSFEVREVGAVKSVRELIVRVVGLPSCMNGQMVEFANGALGMVMGFTEQEVQVLVFGGKGRIRRFACQYRGMDHINKDVTSRGVVTAKKTENGANIVELEVWTEDPDGNKTTPGSATVELPSRNN